MLHERFLARLDAAFPSFYERVNDEARAEAARLVAETGGDVEKALARGRFLGAGRLWWPYVKGSVPFVGNDRAAMEGFSRLVLTVDHVAGHPPGSMEAARAQVLHVLRESLDVERLRRLVDRDAREKHAAKGEAAAGAAAATGLLATLAAAWSPIATVRKARGVLRFVPGPMRLLLVGVALGAVASIPLVAGYSAGRKAERSVRGASAPAKGDEPVASAARPAASSAPL